MAKEPAHFRDFCLLELTVPDPEFVFVLTHSSGRSIAKYLLVAGKEAIDQHTNKGDIILIEAPARHSLKQTQKEFGGRFAFSKDFWEVSKIFLNLYRELAAYAKKSGRIVFALEPSGQRFYNNLEQPLAEERDLTGAEAQRIESFAVSVGKSIQNIVEKRPKLVIASEDPAVFIEQALKPKRVVSQQNLPPFLRKITFEKIRRVNTQAYRQRLELHTQKRNTRKI